MTSLAFLSANRAVEVVELTEKSRVLFLHERYGHAIGQLLFPRQIFQVSSAQRDPSAWV